MVPVVHGDDEHFGIVVCFAAGLLCKSFSFPQKNSKDYKKEWYLCKYICMAFCKDDENEGIN